MEKLEQGLSSKWLMVIVFVAALVFHGWGAAVGWRNENLPGNEFRQTQTALTALFVQKDGDFSLAYPTPVLGYPWSIPFEFPLYQWTVAVTSNVTGLPLVVAARLVSAGCFYLTLPAIWLLLGRMAVDPRYRWLLLSFVVTCPLHIFYARSFLIEMMALMFSFWFLIAYIRGVESRGWAWILVANAAGAGAGLVKVTTFMLYLGPAFLWTLWWYVSAWRAAAGGGLPWRSWGRDTVWALAAVVVPFAATLWWLHFADATKALNPAAEGLTSASLSGYNFGSWANRTDPAIWKAHWHITLTNIAGVPFLIGGFLLSLVVGGKWRRWAWGALGFFLGVQFTFPVLYAWHEYYFVANTTLLMLAVGLVVVGFWELKAIRAWQAWIVTFVFLGLQVSLYARGLYREQLLSSGSNNDMTKLLSAVTGPEDTLFIAGEDWASMIPYYAKRRALMLRRNTERNWEMIQKAMAELYHHDIAVGALVLRDEQRENRELVERATRAFGLDSTVSIGLRDHDIYLHPDNFDRTAKFISLIQGWGGKVGAQITPAAEALEEGVAYYADLPAVVQESFEDFDPKPERVKTKFGLSMVRENNKPFFNGHPDVWLWYRVPAGHHRTTVELRIVPGAWENLAPEDATDGIEVNWIEIDPQGGQRTLFSRQVNPRDNPADRGLQRIEADFELGQGCLLQLWISPGPAGIYTRDWAGLGEVIVR